MTSSSGTENHPFIEALPPATDYVTYLMLIEYNLKKEDLPVLDSVLQNEKLTVNIGWDLVLLLLPLLPDSRSCLDVIARLGNPREVILKVIEALRITEWEGEEQDEENDEEEEANAPSKRSKTKQSSESTSDAEDSLSSLQFVALNSMLKTLHQRIKAKYPSRFMSSSLQAIMAAYNEAPSQTPQAKLIESMLDLTQALGRARSPTLPPRQSSATPNTDQRPTEGSTSDPEAQRDDASKHDRAIQKRLLQSFLTHVVERFASTLSSDDDALGFLLSGRIFEKLFAQMKVPGRQSWEDKWEALALRDRKQLFGKLLGACRDIDGQVLLDAAETPSKILVDGHTDEDEPPNSAEDIPLSATGSLIVLAERKMQLALSPEGKDKHDFAIFPNHAAITQNVIGTEEAGGRCSTGTEPEAIIDAGLALGLIALDANNIGEPKDDETFLQYLQSISLISANAPSSSLRFHAHMHTTTVLRSHPSDLVRLTFIRDTLENCPYENLKVSAVSWVKGEILEANSPEGPPLRQEKKTVFSTPVALEAIGPLLFPDLTEQMAASNLSESWLAFKIHLGFYLASLNFYYLLLTAKYLHGPLQVASLHEQHDIGGSMIGPLRQMSSRFRQCLQGGELADEEGPEGVKAGLLDLDIMEHVLGRVEQGVVELNANE